MALEGIVDSVFKNEDGEICLTFRGINAGVKLPNQKVWFYSRPMPWENSHELRLDLRRDINLLVGFNDIKPNPLQKKQHIFPHPLRQNRIKVLAKANKSKVFNEDYTYHTQARDDQGQPIFNQDGSKRQKKQYQFKEHFAVQSRNIANIGEIVTIEDDLESKLREAQDNPEFTYVDYLKDLESRGFANWEQILQEGICFFDTEQPLFKYPDLKETSHAAFMFYKLKDGIETSTGQYHTLRQVPQENFKGFQTFIHPNSDEMGQAIKQFILQNDPWVLSAANIIHDVRELTNDFGFEVGGKGRKTHYWVSSPLDFPKGIRMHRRIISDTYKIAKKAINFLGNQKLGTFTGYTLDEEERKKDLPYEKLEQYEFSLIKDPKDHQKEGQELKEYQVQDVVVLKNLTDIFGQDQAFLGQWSRLGFDAIQDRTWINHFWEARLLESTGIDINADFPKIRRKKSDTPEKKLPLWKREHDRQNAKQATKRLIEKRIKETFGENTPGTYQNPYAYHVSHSDELAATLNNSIPELVDLIEYKNQIKDKNKTHQNLRKKYLEEVVNELISPIIRDYNIYQKFRKELLEKITTKQIDKEKTREILRSVYSKSGYFQRYHFTQNHNVTLQNELRIGFLDYINLLPEFDETKDSISKEKWDFHDLYKTYSELSDIYFIAKKTYGLRLEELGPKLDSLFNQYSFSVPIIASKGSTIFTTKPTEDKRLIYLGRPKKVQAYKSKVQVHWQNTISGTKPHQKPNEKNQLELF